MSLAPRSKCPFLLIGFVALVLIGVANAQPQTVTLGLRNGDRLTGILVSQDTNSVVIDTPWARGLSIPAAEIVTRTPAVPPPAEGPVQAVAQPKPAEGKEAGAAEGIIKAATKPPKTSVAKNWHGDIQLGLDLLYSEKTRQLFHSKIKLIYTKNRFKNEFDFKSAYGRTDGIVDANRMDGYVKTDFDIGKKWYVYNQAGAGYDEVRKVDFRYEVGPGVGYHLITLSNFVLNTEFGFNYQYEDRADNTTNERFFLRLGENGAWKLNSKLTFDHKLEYFPRVEDPSEFRLRAEGNLRYWLLENLSLNLTVLDVYDSQPARNIERNDLQIRSSVGVKF